MGAVRMTGAAVGRRVPAAGPATGAGRREVPRMTVSADVQITDPDVNDHACLTFGDADEQLAWPA